MNQVEPPPPRPEPTPVVLPRPNLGPEPWSTPGSTWNPTELAVGSGLTLLVLVLALRKRRRRRAATLQGLNPAGPGGPGVAAVLPPDQRLIAAAATIRAALIAEFGPGWGSRTTEEIARDPNLAARLGPETALEVVAYLDRVDRVKFAGEEFDDVDQWIEKTPALLGRLTRGGITGQRPA